MSIISQKHHYIIIEWLLRVIGYKKPDKKVKKTAIVWSENQSLKDGTLIKGT